MTTKKPSLYEWAREVAARAIARGDLHLPAEPPLSWHDIDRVKQHASNHRLRRARQSRGLRTDGKPRAGQPKPA